MITGSAASLTPSFLSCKHHTHCNSLVHNSIIHMEAQRRAMDMIFFGAIFPSLLGLLSPFFDMVFSGKVSLQSSLSLFWYGPRRSHFSHHFPTRSPLFFAFLSEVCTLHVFRIWFLCGLSVMVFEIWFRSYFLKFNIKIDVVLCFWMYVVTFSIFHLCLLTLAFSLLLSHLVLTLFFCIPKLNHKFKG